MADELIYKKIEEIYNSEKGKPFIAHLVRSFLPVFRSTFMLENTKKKQMRCCITGVGLISKFDLVKFQIDNRDKMLKAMTDSLVSGEPYQNPALEKFKGKMMAIECEKSERLLSLPAVQQLLNFASSEYSKGNKHIGYMVKDMRKLYEAKESANQSVGNVDNVSKFNNKYKKSEVKSSQANKVEKKPILKSTTSLGDSDFLQSLKKQLEDAGK